MINLQLTVDQVNTILGSLATQPFQTVAPLIADIKAQGDRQVAEIEDKARIIEDLPALPLAEDDLPTKAKR